MNTSSAARSDWFSGCAPWRVGHPSPSGKIGHWECIRHGGRHFNNYVDLRLDRCARAKRLLPGARTGAARSKPTAMVPR
jgi:hypothetical protein